MATSIILHLYTVKNKGFHRVFLRVFIVSLRENLLVVFIKTFSQKKKNFHKVFIKNLSYQWFCEDFCEKVLMKTTKRFSLRDAMKTLIKRHEPPQYPIRCRREGV